MKAMTVFLGFDKNAEEAVDLYVPLFDKVFGNSKVLHVTHFDEGEITALQQHPDMTENSMPGSAGGAKTIRFTLNSEEFVAFNGGNYFGKFNDSTSIYVSCETQEQIDQLWEVLSVDGNEQPCGWVSDRYNVAWQIVPSFVREIDEGEDREKAERLNIALFGMKKVNIAELERAIQG